MSEHDRGIDYGFGRTNLDPHTGIRYGVIPACELLDVYEALDPYYGEDEEVAQWTEGDWDSAEPLCHVLDTGGYVGEQNSYGDIFLVRSNYYTFAQFCSPCCPGAGYILNHTPDGVKTYCFNHDYFEGGVAPYPVYSVKTGELVQPTN